MTHYARRSSSLWRRLSSICTPTTSKSTDSNSWLLSMWRPLLTHWHSSWNKIRKLLYLQRSWRTNVKRGLTSSKSLQPRRWTRSWETVSEARISIWRRGSWSRGWQKWSRTMWIPKWGESYWASCLIGRPVRRYSGGSMRSRSQKWGRLLESGMR